VIVAKEKRTAPVGRRRFGCTTTRSSSTTSPAAAGRVVGIEWALGRSPDIAINHDPQAVAMHAANHPEHAALRRGRVEGRPGEGVRRAPVGLAWFSPDCKHFSKAKGGKPVSKKIRGLAWIVVKWAKLVKPARDLPRERRGVSDLGPARRRQPAGQAAQGA
jgi:DNA (cytosine-5)-methyltransferase 1